MTDLARRPDLVIQPQRDAQIQRLKQGIQELAGTSLDALTRHDLDERARFENLRLLLADYRDTAQLLATVDIGVLPTASLGAVEQFVNEFTTIRDRLRSFSLTEPGRDWRRDHELASQMVQEKHRNRNSITAEIALAKADAVLAIGPDLSSHVQRVAAESEDARQYFRALSLEAQTLLGVLQNQAKTTSIAAHAAVFRGEAEDYETVAQNWLLAGAGVAGVLIAVGVAHVAMAMSGEGPTTVAQAINQTVAKLIAYSALGTLTLWIGRTYRAARHNAVVNRHRANALKCFEALTLSTSDVATRNAVLLQATQSIFAPQSTGFSGHEAESTPGSQILEVYRSIPAQSPASP
jgi:hypothetical protein